MSSNPSGFSYEKSSGVAPLLADVGAWFKDMRSRIGGHAGVYLADSIDNQNNAPVWMESKTVAIDGKPLTAEEKGPNWWEHKYAKELAIGEKRANQGAEERLVQANDVFQPVRWISRKIGLWPDEQSDEQARSEVEQQLVKQKELAEQATRGINWTDLVKDLESDEPLWNVLQKYRQVYDCYGIDDWLDCGPAVIWFMIKMGATIGVFHGGIRAIKVVHADAQFMNAAGIGVLTFVNTALTGSMIKWVGNFTLWSTAFIAGDRLWTLQMRTLFDPKHQRSPGNYAAGVSFAFGTLGILPYWLLNDARLAARVSFNGFVLGGAVGWCFGLGMQRVIMMNLGRVQMSPNEFNCYAAMVKREKARINAQVNEIRVAHELKQGVKSPSVAPA